MSDSKKIDVVCVVCGKKGKIREGPFYDEGFIMRRNRWFCDEDMLNIELEIEKNRDNEVTQAIDTIKTRIEK